MRATRRQSGLKKSHGAASRESIEVFQAVLEHAQLLLQFLTKLYGAVILGTESVDLLIVEAPHHLRGEPVPTVDQFQLQIDRKEDQTCDPELFVCLVSVVFETMWQKHGGVLKK